MSNYIFYELLKISTKEVIFALIWNIIEWYLESFCTVLLQLISTDDNN